MKNLYRVKGKKIKKGFLPRLLFFSLSITFLVGSPVSALSLELNLVSDYLYEDIYQSGPQNIIDTIGNWFGVDLIGPGGVGVAFETVVYLFRERHQVFRILHGNSGTMARPSMHALNGFGRQFTSLMVVSGRALISA